MRSNTQLRAITFFFIIIALLTPVYVSSVAATPTSHHISGVPLVAQGSRPWCGPGAVTMVLQYWSVDITLEEVGAAIDAEENGCCTYEITEYLATFEVGIYEFNSMDELKHWIDIDHPLIILQWTDEYKRSGHYRVVTGYCNDYVYINDPHGYTAKISYELFFVLWSRHDQYGVTISPKKTYVTDPYTNRTVHIGERLNV